MPGSEGGREILSLKAGEWVEVRSQTEILTTLDARACFDNLPFMPEMLQFSGQRFRVYKRSDKTCDPAHTPWSIRRMKNSVHLEGVRCTGEGHGGCQAGCLIWWNEAWLKRVENHSVPAGSLGPVRADQVSTGESDREGGILAPCHTTDSEGQVVYSCQATEIRNFTSYMSWWSPGQYVRDLRSGNLKSGHSKGSKSERLLELVLGIFQVCRAFLISFFTEQRHLNYPPVVGTLEKTAAEGLGLQTGELVKVRTKEEIIETLDKNSRNRGLLFDGEMLRYCDGIYRVLRRVDRIIDEKTGKMMSMKHPCIVLEGVVCQSDFHRLCPRAIYPYWRENWLKRVESYPVRRTPEQAAETCDRS